MPQEFRPIALTIVDFMGAFLPGCVWLLAISAYDWNFVHRLGRPSIFAALQHFLSGGTTALVGTPYYFALAAFAAILGFAVKHIVMLAAEWCSRPETWYKSGKGDRFPYTNEYRLKPYFETICSLITSRTGVASKDLPVTYQPFSACKRILREMRSELADELEHAEAESRMLGSLFLAVLAFLLPVLLSTQWDRVMLWAVATVGLGYSFRKARRREINYCYLNFLIAAPDAAKPLEICNDAPTPEARPTQISNAPRK